MSSMDHISLGLILVGVGMTLKVIREALMQIGDLRHKRDVLRRTAEQCRAAAEEERKEADKFKLVVDELKRELNGLLSNETQMAKKIATMQKKLNRRTQHKFKVDALS